MNKIAIVTALCGNIETLSNPSVVHPNADYFAFVSQTHPNANIWTQLPAYSFSNDSKYALRRNAKIYKILPNFFLPNYEYYIWVDVSHDVIVNPELICSSFLNGFEIAGFRHTRRECIYDEAMILLELGYDHKELIHKQMEFYVSKGYPSKNGMFELSTFVRRNTHAINTACLKWWDNICKFSSRDQLSFMYAMWESGLYPNTIPGFANGHNKNGTIGNNDFIPQTRQHIPSGRVIH